MMNIRLFEDGKDYADDVFVGINGKSYIIQRGVEVSVPLCVARVLEHSANMDKGAKQTIESLKARYAKRL